MKNNNPHKFELIASVLHGEETGRELDESEFSDAVDDFDKAKKIYNVKEQVVQLGKLGSEEKAWKRIHSRISVRRVTDWNKWLSYAAVFVGAVILSSTFHYFISDKLAMNKAETFATVNSPRGQITSLILFDGTIVWLNSGSTIKYSSRFGTTEREVSLDGEALFEVHKDRNKSFVVNMGDSKILVHGTTFNAKNYPTEKEVVLLEGTIEYSKLGENHLMKPNERMIENKKSGELILDQVDASLYSSWIGGKIFFDNETLENLSMRLERWYDMSFVFEKDNIKSYKFTGVINKDKSLDYTLKIIELTNKVKFRKERDKIIITE